MEQKDQHSINMWRVVIHYLDRQTPVWNSNTFFSQAKAELEEALRNADLALQAQANNTTGITQTKEGLERNAVREVVAVAKVARAYALDTGNRELSGAIDFSKSFLLDLPDAALVARLKSIMQAVQPFLPQLRELGLTGIQPALDAIDAYSRAMAAPRSAISGRVAVTTQVPQILKSGKIALEKLDNIVHVFDAKSPGFSAGYKPCRVTVG